MKKGFTIIEALITLGILSFVVIGIYAVFNMADKTYNEDMGLVDLQQEVRQAIGGMVREIRQGSRASMNIDVNGALTFSIPNAANITYQLNTGSHQIIRQLSGTSKVLANDIQGLNFCWWDGVGCCASSCGNLQVLRVSIDASKMARRRLLSFSLAEQIRLRN
ncbi:MAG: prepilin-type N-terminal cleavage/methylation domain-containing protein [Candidatus Omnitrophica bacterium]|nr:prepilin-type N-terminal cleavage/methylation domain-containing protein [Candidatus Omnitrophota bacterium]